MRFCTVAGSRSLPHARSLAGRIAEHYPDHVVTVLAHESHDELPRLLEALLEAGDGPLVYLAPTLDLFTPLDQMDQAVAEHPVVVVGDGLVIALTPSPEAKDYLEAVATGAAPTDPQIVHVLSEQDAGVVNMADIQPLEYYLLAPDAAARDRSKDEDVRELVNEYTTRLIEHGWTDEAGRDRVGHRLANGVLFDGRLLLLHADAKAHGLDFGDIFTQDGTERFVSWLRAPLSPDVSLSRVLAAVYAERADLIKAYPDVASPDASRGSKGLSDSVGFAGWAWTGRKEHELPVELLPPPPNHVRASIETRSLSVEIIGYLTATLGLGEAARLYYEALRATDIEVSTRAIEVNNPKRRNGELAEDYGRREFDGVGSTGAPDINLICVNAPELPEFARSVGDGLLESQFNIGVWAWETDVIPQWWDPAFAYLDEIWVYSRYVAENLARVSPVPVVPIPPPTILPATETAAPELGLPEGFRFMFMFDFNSTPARKNPAGVIEAFKRAFEPGEGPHLVIKTIHADAKPAAYHQLVAACEGRDDMRVVDCSLSAAEKDALLASCDCYVSLHRSEGYGLPLAECMAMGKPVIATGYSGNLDFMSTRNSYLVDYTLTCVGPGVEIYPAHGTWAEPDLDQAATQMRAVFDDQEESRARGERAREEILTSLSAESVGRIATARIARLADGRLHGRPRGPAPRITISHRVARVAVRVPGLRRLVSPAKALRRLVRRH